MCAESFYFWCWMQVHQGWWQIAYWLLLACPGATILVLRGNQMLCCRLWISIWKLCCRWLVLIPICWLYYLHFSIKKSWQWFVIIANYDFSSLKVIVPFHDCIIYTLGLLFSGAPFPLCVSEGMWKESYWEFCSIMFLRQLYSTGIIWCICINYVTFLWIWIVQY